LKFKAIFGNNLPHCTIFARRERLGDRFWYSYETPEDYFLWFKLLFEKGEDGSELIFSFYNYPLSVYRTHKNRISADYEIV
jgi:hypothetical protein